MIVDFLHMLDISLVSDATFS